ncbi:MAG TPA: ATPase, T2SS/T4P/T4SS family, partial [Gemmatimonadaceae bacterium]|nr:ATPase, T2SS/T4P/T4SS family [Gemmatimonadaceae bacterium]
DESYWETAVSRELATDQSLLRAVATHYRMKVADLAAASLGVVSPQARDLVPESLARRYGVVPVSVADQVLEVATSDPTDVDCERAVGFASGRKVRLVLAAPADIAVAIETLYHTESQVVSAISRILENVADKYDVQAIPHPEDDGDLADLSGAGVDRPVIRLVDYLIAEAVTSRASDIHLEAEESGIFVRYRIDGVLRQVLELPRVAGVPLVSRVKIMSGMDIADRLRPQDGRARVVVNGKQVDLRVSTLPATHGEKVVIRILDPASSVMSLEAMGLNPDELDRLQRLLEMREGIVLVTGPTGSGKTTTLYTALRQVAQRGGVNVVTVEDPVEYRLPGIVQVQVNEKAGLTFAAALRSILRQDPDVVLVGEIRDRETAGIAVQASLTGHLVFSTLHTLDAASSITRLVDIGVESYKIAAALRGIVAQRLVRRLCEACRRPVEAPRPPRLRRWFPEGSRLHEAVGCAECGATGYRGRISVLEVLMVDGEVERRIAANEPVDRVVEAARAGGMRSLWGSGVQHALAGTTSVDELLRVLDLPLESPAPRPGAAAASGDARARPALRRVVEAPPADWRGGVPTPIWQSAVVGDGPWAPPILPPEALELVDDPLPAPLQGESRPTVLLVEDEDPLRGVLGDLLGREGYVVLEAADGVEALELVDRAAPDLVVLDLTLPRLDGYAVLSRLRTRRDTREVPVIVLTAREDEDAEVRVFELGAVDFLSKPFRPRALMARIRAQLRRTPAGAHVTPVQLPVAS